MRLILIDDCSGYIFGEFRSSDYTGNFDMRACLTEADRLVWYRSPPIGALIRYRHAAGQPLRFPVL